MEMKRLSCRVHVQYEAVWRQGKLKGFYKGRGMDLAFTDGGALQVTNETPVMIRIENLVEIEQVNETRTSS
jgi:hypothetical protein